jgi:predicted transcriptional regulator
MTPLAQTADTPSPKQIRDIRRMLGLTIAKLAREASVSTSFLAEIERGDKKASPAVAYRINEALLRLMGGAK